MTTPNTTTYTDFAAVMAEAERRYQELEKARQANEAAERAQAAADAEATFRDATKRLVASERALDVLAGQQRWAPHGTRLLPTVYVLTEEELQARVEASR